MIDNQDSEAVKTSWAGWLSEGKVSYDRVTAFGELINNILTKKTVNSPSKQYTMQIVVDSETSQLWVTDNFVGVPMHELSALHDLGKSYDNGAILSEHGGGSKSAVCWFGHIQWFRSSVDGNDFYDKLPDRRTEWAKFHKPKKTNPIERYDVEKNKWVIQETSGLQTYIKMFDKQTPKRKDWFENLVTGLGCKYFLYLNETLKIEIIWLKNGNYHNSWWVNPIKPLLSAEPTKDRPSISSNKMLGQNVWSLEELWKCPDTGIVLDLKIGWAAHPDNVIEYYNESSDNIYNPEEYKLNPYRYAGPEIGIHYCKQGVPISGGNFLASSRSEALIGFIDIISGVSTVKTKNGIWKSDDVLKMEENLIEHLKKNGFRIRSKSKYYKLSETKMEETLLKKLKSSAGLRRYLGYDDCDDFDNQWPAHSGIPDIVGFTSDKVIRCVAELKKEGGNALWKAVFQGLSYAKELNTTKILIVAQDPNLPSDIEKKLDVWRQYGYEFEYEQYQHLIENF